MPDGEFGPLAVNVADQRRDNDSMLNWMERVIRRRRETPEIGWGTCTILDARDNAVLAHRCDWEDSTVVVVHNFDGAPREVRVAVGRNEGDQEAVDLLDSGAGVHRLTGRGDLDVKLEGYGHRWFRIRAPGTRSTP